MSAVDHGWVWPLKREPGSNNSEMCCAPAFSTYFLLLMKPGEQSGSIFHAAVSKNYGTFNKVEYSNTVMQYNVLLAQYEVLCNPSSANMIILLFNTWCSGINRKHAHGGWKRGCFKSRDCQKLTQRQAALRVRTARESYVEKTHLHIE